MNKNKYINFIKNNLDFFKKAEINKYEQFIDDGKIVIFKKIKNGVNVYLSSMKIGINEMNLFFTFNLIKK